MENAPTILDVLTRVSLKAKTNEISAHEALKTGINVGTALFEIESSSQDIQYELDCLAATIMGGTVNGK